MQTVTNFDALMLAQAPDAPTSAPDMLPDAVATAPQKVLDTFQNAFQEIGALVPNVLAMLAILVIGFLLAKLIGRLATVLCQTIGLQTAAERSGLAASMQQVGIVRSVPSIVGVFVFWLLFAVALVAAFNVLGLAAVSEAMMDVVQFIPKILLAIVVVVIGLLVASFLRGVVATSADRVGISYAEHLANACYYVLALITFLAAASHLGLEIELIERLLLIGFGALAAGSALAFGLGGREVMGGILSGYYLRQRFTAGDHVRVAEFEGTVREVGPVSTIIETDEGGLLHRHSIPNTLMLKEGIR
jgi:hypothetical protein